ncbi:hypothetical protein ACJMK2_044032 [Sinanodonta woodiana]|uniref:Uncharacterized protein n=1 Tax=Sinanodonta woodiana TaxID=1069815 RepID=A0ABD3W009_SINWO
MVILADVETILSLTTLLWLSKLVYGQFPPPVPHHPRVKIHSDSIGFPAEPVDTNITLPVERSAPNTDQHVTTPPTWGGLWNGIENQHDRHLGSSHNSPWSVIDHHQSYTHPFGPHNLLFGRNALLPGRMHRRLMLRHLFLQNPILFQRQFPFLYRRFMRIFFPHGMHGFSFDNPRLDQTITDTHPIQSNPIPHPLYAPEPKPEPYSKAKSKDFKKVSFQTELSDPNFMHFHNQAPPHL